MYSSDEKFAAVLPARERVICSHFVGPYPLPRAVVTHPCALSLAATCACVPLLFAACVPCLPGACLPSPGRVCVNLMFPTAGFPSSRQALHNDLCGRCGDPGRDDGAIQAPLTRSRGRPLQRRAVRPRWRAQAMRPVRVAMPPPPPCASWLRPLARTTPQTKVGEYSICAGESVTASATVRSIVHGQCALHLPTVHTVRPRSAFEGSRSQS